MQGSRCRLDQRCAAHQAKRLQCLHTEDGKAVGAILLRGAVNDALVAGRLGGSGQGLIAGVTLPVDGTYRIVVSGEKGGAGNYELTVTEAPPSKPGTLITVGPGDAPILITR